MNMSFCCNFLIFWKCQHRKETLHAACSSISASVWTIEEYQHATMVSVYALVLYELCNVFFKFNIILNIANKVKM